uniref:beta strand repeat-containing protein n=1 Tax=Enterobacter asburiae TaxID=61645 RepID=UPI0025AE3CDA|nr:Ig-like domain-containing protein [Enterobacter asburiae]
MSNRNDGTDVVNITKDTEVSAPLVSLTRDTGNSSDSITSDAGVTVNGLEKNAKWEYSLDGANWVTGNGDTIPPSVFMNDGSYTVHVRQTDPAGNVSPVSIMNFTLDTEVSAPLVSLTRDTGNSSDSITSDAGVTVNGLEKNAKWEYSLDGANWVTGNGDTIPPSVFMNDGSYTVHVRQTDPAGNVSPVSIMNFTLDTEVSAPLVSLTRDTGNSSDSITSDAGVTVNGLEKNAKWEYSLDGANWVTGNGDTIPPSVFMNDGSYTVHVRQTDPAGNVSPVSIMNFTLDTEVSAPLVSLTRDTGNSSDSITSDAGVTVNGLEKNAKWEYSLDGANWVTGNGDTIPPSVFMNDGSYTVHVRQTDPAGNVSPVSIMNFTLDTEVSAPLVSLTRDTGNSSDSITSDAGVTVNGLEKNAKWEYSLDGANWVTGNGDTIPPSVFMNDGSYTVHVRQTDPAGNVSPVSIMNFTLDTEVSAPLVSLSLDTGTNANDDITSNNLVNVSGVSSDSNWQYRINNGEWLVGNGSSFNLIGGENIYEVMVTDIAGNIASSTKIFNLLLKPNQKISIDQVTDDVGIVRDIARYESTDGNTLNLSGTISDPLGQNGAEKLAIYDGSEFLGFATVNSDNTWSFTTPSLPKGLRDLSVRVEIPGEIYGSSEKYPVNILGLEAVSIVNIQSNIDGVTSNIVNGASTADALPVIKGSVAGKLSPGERVEIWDASTNSYLGNALFGGNGLDWAWTPDSNNPLSASVHSLIAKIVNESGETLVETQTQTFTVTSSVPEQVVTIAAVSDNAGVKQGSLTSGESTDDATLALSGTLSAALGAGEQVAVFDGETLLGYATVAPGATAWTYATPALGAGTHALTARVVNTATGLKGEASPAFTVIETALAISAVSDDAGSVIGSVAAGGSTDDARPTLSGTLAAPLGAGERVAVYDGGTLLGYATVTVSSWSFTPADDLGAGQHTLRAEVQNSSGSTLLKTGDYVVNVMDGTSGTPAQTVTIAAVSDNAGVKQGSLTSGESTDDATLALSGTLSAALGAGEQVAVYDGATLLGYATVAPGATAWTYATPALGAGTHALTARVENTATGLKGEASPAFTVIETALAISAVSDDAGSVIGSVAAGGSTDDARPTLTGTLAAPLGAGEQLAVYDGGTLLGHATVTGSSWSFTPADDLGAGQHTLRAEVQNSSGSTLLKTGDYVVNVVDGTSGTPAQTVTIAAVSDNVGVKQGSLTSGESTDDSTLALSGTLSAALGAGERVAVYDGATLLGYATVAPGATAWTYATPALGAGTHALTARVVNAATGLRGEASDVFATNYTVTSGVIMVVSDDVGSVIGSVAAGGSTDDARPTLSGTLTAPLGAGERVAVYDGETLLGHATVTGSSWSFTPDDALAIGKHTLRLDIIGSSGQLLMRTGGVVVNVVDGTSGAPAQTVTIAAVSDNAGVKQGSLTSGESTDDATLALSGTLSAALGAGEQVAVYDGATLLGYATVAPGATVWTYATPALGAGTHALTARVENAATGLKGEASPAFTVIETALAISAVSDDAGSVIGSVAAGGSTDDARPTLSGTLAAPLGAGERVAVYDGATLLGHATVTGSSWSFTPADALGAGQHTLRAEVQNIRGSTLLKTGDYVVNVVDGTSGAPAQTVTIVAVSDNAGVKQGSLTSGESTDDATLALSGTLSAALGAGEQVAVYDGETLLGYATVAPGATAWTYATPALGAGTHALTARVENAVTGLKGEASPAFTVNETSLAISAVSDDAGSVIGSVAAGGSTDDARPTLTGTLAAPLGAGEQLAVYDGGTLLGHATVTGSSWSFTPADALGAGQHTLRAEVQNSGGSTLLKTGDYVVNVVDGTSGTPAQTVTIAAVSDNAGVKWGSLTSGESTDDATLALSGTLSAALGAGEQVAVYDGETLLGYATVAPGATAWTYETPALGAGTHALTARVENAATGLKGEASPAFTVIETALAISAVSDDAGSVIGSVAAGGSTDDARPTLSGTLAAPLGAGERVAVYDGATLLGHATVTVSSWSFTPTDALGAGQHTLRAEVQNSGGSTLLKTGDYVVNVVDGTSGAPAQTVTIAAVSDNVGVKQGNLTSGESTDDTTLALSGTLSAALGAGEQVAVYSGDTLLGYATVAPGATAWTYTTGMLAYNTPALRDGVRELTARVENAATGLKGEASPAFTVIKTAMSISAVSDDAGSVIGSVAAGGSTDDARPTLSGTLAAPLGAGERVAVYDGGTLLGHATVTGSSWSFTPANALGAGQHTLRAEVQNSGGSTLLKTGDYVVNVMDGTSGATAQTVTIAAVSDNAGVKQGSLTSGESTDDATLALSGTLSAALGAGEQVAVYDGATLLGYATVAPGATVWTYATPALGAGTHALTARVENAATGLKGEASPAFTVIETALAISAVSDDAGSVIGSVAAGGSTDDARPTLTGTLAAPLGAGERVAVYDGGTLLGHATVTGSSWSFTPANVLGAGQHTLRAEVQNIRGSTLLKTGDYVVNVVDGTSGTPAQTVTIVAVSDNAGVKQGSLTSGESTDDTTLALSGTLSAVLGAGEQVAVYDGATLLGYATVDAGTTVWTYETPALGAGTHALTARVENAATGLKGEASPAFTVIETALSISAVSDDAEGIEGKYTLSLDLQSDGELLPPGGILGKGNVDNILMPSQIFGPSSSYQIQQFDNATPGKVTFWVAAQAGSVVRATLVELTNSDNGDVLATLLQSKYITTVLAYMNINWYTQGTSIDVPLPLPSLKIKMGEVVIAYDTPTITGKLDAPLGAGEQVAVYDGATLLGHATVTGSSWSFTPADALGAGQHTLRAEVQNSSGSTLLKTGDYVVNVVDGTSGAPAQTVTIAAVSDNAGVKQGSLTSGESTDDSLLSLSGTLSAALGAGERVAVYDGETLLGYATVDAGATAWTYATPALGAGTHALTARVVNAATGLRGEASDVFATNYTVTSGAIMVVSDDAGSVIGSVAAGGSTDDARPTLSGTLVAPLGAGEQLAVYDGETLLGHATVTGSSWSFTPDDALAIGKHTLRLDVIGSSGQLLMRTGGVVVNVVDGTSGTPAQTVIIVAVSDNAGVKQGSLTSGESTDDATLALSGTLSAALGAGEQVAVYDGETLLGYATVAPGATAWTYATPALGAGTRALTARVENTATGLKGEASPAFTVIETALSISAVSDDAGSVIGSVAAGGSTDDERPTLSGTLAAPLGAGEQLAVYDGGTLLGHATVTGSSWSFTPADALGAGQHTLRAEVQNSGGSTLLKTGDYVVNVVDGTSGAPAQTVTIVAVSDNAGVKQGSLTSGESTDDATLALSGTLSAALGAGEQVAVYDGETLLGYATVDAGTTVWTYETPALGAGTHALTAQVENTATGLKGGASQVFSIDEIMGDTFRLGQFDINVDKSASMVEPIAQYTLEDVMSSGVDIYNNESGWVGLQSDGRHQLLIVGDSGDTIGLEGFDSNKWTSGGSITHNDNTYNVYNSAESLAQVLVDTEVKVDGSIY